MLYYQENFTAACTGFDDNVRNVVKALFRKGDRRRRGQAQSHLDDPSERRLAREPTVA